MERQVNTNPTPAPASCARDNWLAGGALVAIGSLLLAAQSLRTEWIGPLVPAGLGLIFLVWGAGARRYGLLIPGGILTGVGLGAALVEGLPALGDRAQGGVFLLAFALGWGLITLLARLACNLTVWWPLIPGGIMAVIGGALLAGGAGLQALELAGRLWPLALVAAGLVVIFRRRAAN